MAKRVNHDLRCVDGRTLVMPKWKGGQEGWGNLDLNGIDIRDTYASQQFPVGTKLIDGERVFYYAKASSVGVTNADMAVKNGYRQHVAYATVAADAAKGATSLTIDVASGDGAAGDGVIAANELAGGFVVIFGHDSDAHTCRIAENTAVAAGGGEMTLTLMDEINATLVTDSDHAECMAHWALGCETNTTGLEPVVGVSHTVVTASYWFWLQTWGVCWLAPQAAVGSEANNNNCVFRHDASLDECDYSDSNNSPKAQQAGFVLAHASGGGQGAPFIMLQICP